MRNSSSVQLFLDDYQNGRFLGNATHVWPQADKIDCVDSDAFSFIGKVENFADDMSALFPTAASGKPQSGRRVQKGYDEDLTYGRAETLALCKILAVDFYAGYAIPVECAGAVAATARSRAGNSKRIMNGHPNATPQPTTKNLL